MDLIYLLKVLYRKIWIIIGVPVIAGVAAFLFTRDMKKEYKSTAQLSTGFTTNNRVQIAKENFDYWESKANFENMIEMMKSELIGSMVCYDLLLHDLKDNNQFRKSITNLTQAEKESIEKVLNSKLANFELLTTYNAFENKVIEILSEKEYEVSKWIKSKSLVIDRIRDTDFIKVEFSSENPFLSSYVVNKLCDEYIRYNGALRNTVTEESLEFFANQVDQKKKYLDQKTLELSSFKSSNQVFDYERESGARVGQLADFENRLQEEENALKGVSIALRKTNARISNYGKVGNNNAKLLELKDKISELNKLYIADGSRDKDLAAQIADLRSQLQGEMQKHELRSDETTAKPKSLNELLEEKEQLELRYEVSSATVASLRTRVQSLRGNLSRIGSKESTIASFERERENAFVDYTSALDKYNETKTRSLISGNGVKVMIKGQPNAEPESSKTLLILALAIIGSGALCVGTIIMVEYFDYRIKTPDKFESFSKVSLIGYVNQLDHKKIDIRGLFNHGDSRKDIELARHLLRKIRFVIGKSNRRVFLVSSTKMGQGKTFIIMSLAHSLSLLNKRVLLIDTNFKNNSLTKLLAAKPMLQKANEFKLLNDSISHQPSAAEEYSRGFISQTNDKNVDIICSKEGLESPSEIFAGKDFEKVIKTLKEMYDYIFLEGASLNDYSDTKELIEYVDGVVVVFSAQSTLKLVDRESIKYLKTLNGKFLGAVLNNIKKEDIKV